MHTIPMMLHERLKELKAWILPPSGRMTEKSGRVESGAVTKNRQDDKRRTWNGRMDNGRIVRRSRRMTGEFEMRYT